MNTRFLFSPRRMARVWIFLAGLLTVVCGASAVETISGRVTNASTGFGIVGVDLDAFDANGNSVALAAGRSSTNGNYSMTVPGPGTYRVRADASLTLGFSDEYHQEVFLLSQASPVVVTTNQNRTGINFTLAIGYNVSGRVLRGATGVGSIDIDVYAPSGEFLSGYPATTAADGSFSVGALPPGSYYIRANPDPALGQFQTTRYFPSSATLAGATPIVITNASLTGRNITVTDGGAIGGKVTSTLGANLSGMDLDVYDLAGIRQDVTALTKADGTYVLPVLPAGGYKLRVDPTLAQGYPRTYHPSAYALSTAGTVTVVVGATTSGINFSLPVAGQATGVIRRADNSAALSGVDLDIYDSADQRVDITTLSAANGSFTVGPLAPGSYHLRADPAAQSGFQVQYYNGKPTLLTADAVVITSGATTSNINFDLAGGGWIDGTVTRSGTGALLSGVDLDLYNAADDSRVTITATTAIDGTYLLGPLAPGSYKLRCDPTPEQFLAVEYFDSKLRLVDANPIIVVSGAGATGRNFVLDGGATIRGRVTRASSGAALSGIDIDVLTAGTFLRLDQSAKTDANGNFVAGPLPVGTYIVRADAPLGSAFLDAYFPASTTTTGATVLTISAGADLPNINITLPENPRQGWLLQ